VGIGTTSPANKLHVSDTTTGTVKTRTEASTGYVDVGMGGNSGVFDTTATDGIRLRTSGNDRLAIDTSGNVGIGTSSPTNRLTVNGGSGSSPTIRLNGGTAADDNALIASKYNVQLSCNADGNIASRAITFQNSTTEYARITSTGRLGVGTTNPTALLAVAGGVGSGAGVQLAVTWNGDFFGYACDAGSYNAALTGIGIQKVTSTNRSLSAAGTLNASGADYAEYMTKCGNFTVAKGDVVGVDANGKLTNVFADAISFVVKSTDPSYVGGDSWGSKSQNKDGEKYTPEELEAIRQTVDRIAFSGQVPVNVTGATAGQYIIPVNNNGAIKGEAVSNPTFEQYQIAVGKVVAIESDGRAKIIVKVA
jgi:hypothetical protein